MGSAGVPPAAFGVSPKASDERTADGLNRELQVRTPVGGTPTGDDWDGRATP
jgi:hypothetical protein